jgi:hypothetical protein
VPFQLDEPIENGWQLAWILVKISWNGTRNKRGGENLAVITSRGGVLLGKSANKISK